MYVSAEISKRKKLIYPRSGLASRSLEIADAEIACDKKKKKLFVFLFLMSFYDMVFKENYLRIKEDSRLIFKEKILVLDYENLNHFSRIL